jgi:hypothetical protein
MPRRAAVTAARPTPPAAPVWDPVAGVPATRDQLLACLGAMSALERAYAWRVLLDQDTVQAISGMGHEAVHQLTRAATYDDVGALLGIGRDAVKKAVTRHNRTTAAAAAEETQ